MASSQNLKKGYSSDRKYKRCRGPLHPEGVMLPVHLFSINGDVRMSWCRRCIQNQRGRNPNNIQIPFELADPIIKFLKIHFGPKYEIALRLGWNVTYLSTKRETMHGLKFYELLDLAVEVCHEKGISPSSAVQGTRLDDSYVVSGAELSHVLKDWSADWLRDKGHYESEITSIGEHLGRTSMGNSDRYSPVQFLYEKTGISHKVLVSLIDGEKTYVSLCKADKVLTAIQRTELIDLGEMKVILNPLWRPIAYVKLLQRRGQL